MCGLQILLPLLYTGYVKTPVWWWVLWWWVLLNQRLWWRAAAEAGNTCGIQLLQVKQQLHLRVDIRHSITALRCTAHAAAFTAWRNIKLLGTAEVGQWLHLAGSRLSSTKG
jgi:hypothetical protein